MRAPFKNMDARVQKIVAATIAASDTGRIPAASIRTAHVSVYGERPVGPSLGARAWDKRLAADCTRARRAGVLARLDGAACRPPVAVGARGKREIVGRDDVELWGRPFGREAARVMVLALARQWGPDRSPIKASAIVRALQAHGYKFTLGIDAFTYEIRDPSAAEVAYDRAVAKVHADVADLVASKVIDEKTADRVRSALTAKLSAPPIV